MSPVHTPHAHSARARMSVHDRLRTPVVAQSGYVPRTTASWHSTGGAALDLEVVVPVRHRDRSVQASALLFSGGSVVLLDATTTNSNFCAGEDVQWMEHGNEEAMCRKEGNAG